MSFASFKRRCFHPPLTALGGLAPGLAPTKAMDDFRLPRPLAPAGGATCSSGTRIRCDHLRQPADSLPIRASLSLHWPGDRSDNERDFADVRCQPAVRRTGQNRSSFRPNSTRVPRITTFSLSSTIPAAGSNPPTRYHLPPSDARTWAYDDPADLHKGAAGLVQNVRLPTNHQDRTCPGMFSRSHHHAIGMMCLGCNLRSFSRGAGPAPGTLLNRPGSIARQSWAGRIRVLQRSASPYVGWRPSESDAAKVQACCAHELPWFFTIGFRTSFTRVNQPEILPACRRTMWRCKAFRCHEGLISSTAVSSPPATPRRVCTVDEPRLAERRIINRCCFQRCGRGTFALWFVWLLRASSLAWSLPKRTTIPIRFPAVKCYPLRLKCRWEW